MRLCDEEGHVLARIYEPLGLQISGEELEGRRAHQGEAYTTTQVQNHLEGLCPSRIPRRAEFRVEWLPQARHDLELIWRGTITLPPRNRQRAAAMKLIRKALDIIGPEVRAWATLPGR